MRPRGRSGVVLAGLLLALSLGLPWGHAQRVELDLSAPMVIPLFNGFAGGYTGLQTVPTYSNTRVVSHTVVGAGHPARFGIVAALLLLAWGHRGRAAAVLVAQLLLSGGAGFTAGGVAAAWVAVIVLAGPWMLARRRGDMR